MRIVIHAVGRLKAGPERDLVARYLDRAEKAGRAVGFTGVSVREIPESRAAQAAARKDEEAAALLAGLADRSLVIALDERGETPSSEAFAAEIGTARDAGQGELALLIGGADGHGPAVLQRAARRIALGRMTWPHQIVRILVAEQIYRTVTILSGHPYHRA
ncbi:23S rRNA (pseudouridine(1915)-N(3))-methyltransferase RlmH [Methylobrevis pamukkalensis]|uniref:Ribosomal RNA large subunit methyltransferase H n=1 Tax=Methylobrevis pamukkalensis TaxID=1439726 RepID=A0A1E3H876_9HYPH|nr:23S rRNA (pseudouridine(1915)-N(3))-methyltransferase RlmH [Methylobrevis pamukkalensis]ODN72538.1 Ribosomal RNA large subunit methyltransferase H [Methylobrevis pamukkalensis]